MISYYQPLTTHRLYFQFDLETKIYKTYKQSLIIQLIYTTIISLGLLIIQIIPIIEIHIMVPETSKERQPDDS